MPLLSLPQTFDSRIRVQTSIDRQINIAVCSELTFGHIAQFFFCLLICLPLLDVSEIAAKQISIPRGSHVSFMRR